MICIKCKTELRDFAKFCDVCGASQTPPARTPKKRGNGEGTVFKRGKTWTAKYTYGWAIDYEKNKKRQLVRTKGGFSTKKEALEYLQTLKNGGQSVKSRTLEYYWQAYSNSELINLSKDKKINYKKAYERLKPLHSRKISGISIAEIQDIINIETPTYYPARDIRTVVSKLWTLAEIDGEVSKNLSKFLVLPKLEEKEPTHFDENHLKTIWHAFGDGEIYAGYILLMCYTGMMPGELRALKPEMIDIEHRQIVGAGLKTKERKQKAMILPEKILMVAEMLIDMTDGKLLSKTQENDFYAEYNEFLKRYDLPKYPPYSCRHSTGTALALAGVTAPVIQRIMRHAKITTTQRYMHLGDADEITVQSANKIFQIN